MSEKTNAEKPTERIRKRLDDYTALLREIDNQNERLDTIETKMAAPPGPNMTGLPSGKGSPPDRVSMIVIRKLALEEQIAKTVAMERAENAAIEAMIVQMADPDERAAIRMRYFDRYEWEDIAFALYGDRPDYTERAAAYQRRIFRLHGRALLHLAAIAEEMDGDAGAGDSKVVTKRSQ